MYATDTLVVDVTQEDIDLGEPQDPESCALARALARQTGADWVTVGTYTATVDNIVYAQSRRTRNFVNTFDHYRKAAQPGRFILQPYKGLE